ncbi:MULTISPECIES: hypothetical protein [unclassified Caballeronia]|uniref:hypothetical protein n=1 Tax=unclassified Caballeronia TaxID=2646786 RepID=UPI00202808E9|nr:MULTISPECIES: hypothetical protein [unclassified Caballeronia]
MLKHLASKLRVISSFAMLSDSHRGDVSVNCARTNAAESRHNALCDALPLRISRIFPAFAKRGLWKRAGRQALLIALLESAPIVFVVSSVFSSTAHAAEYVVKEISKDGITYAYLPRKILSDIPFEQAPKGQFLIRKGSRPAALNELHRRVCESAGMRDVSNDLDSVVSNSSIDALLCAGDKVGAKGQKKGARKQPPNLPDIPQDAIVFELEKHIKDVKQIPHPEASDGTGITQIKVDAPDTHAGAGGLYSVTGQATFSNLPPDPWALMRVWIDEPGPNPPSAKWEGPIRPTEKNLTLSVESFAERGGETYHVAACVDRVCDSADGHIYHHHWPPRKQRSQLGRLVSAE